MRRYDYGDAYKAYALGSGPHTFPCGSQVQVHDIFQPLPDFMYNADALFIDPPWNKGNYRSFYTKAELAPMQSYEQFYKRLFGCIAEIAPSVCYVEVGKQYLAQFIWEMGALFKHTTFYNSSYYHRRENICYVIRGAHSAAKPKLEHMDEEDIIKWICENEKYDCIGDLCMGRGLVGLHAFKNSRRFVGTELNHKRLSVLLKNIYEQGYND